VIRALDMFRRDGIEKEAQAPHLHMAGPSSWEMADMLVAVGEAAEKVNGWGVYVGRDGRGHGELPAIKATWARTSWTHPPLPEPGARGLCPKGLRRSGLNGTAAHSPAALMMTRGSHQLVMSGAAGRNA
jgi:hypothetical protein